MQKLHSYAENNKVTTGKFTIGDEKVRILPPRPNKLANNEL